MIDVTAKLFRKSWRTQPVVFTDSWKGENCRSSVWVSEPTIKWMCWGRIQRKSGSYFHFVSPSVAIGTNWLRWLEGHQNGKERDLWSWYKKNIRQKGVAYSINIFNYKKNCIPLEIVWHFGNHTCFDEKIDKTHTHRANSQWDTSEELA